MSSYRMLLSNSKTRRGSSYLLEENFVPEQKLPAINERGKGGSSSAAATTVTLTLPPIVITPRNESSATAPRKDITTSKSPTISPRLLLAASDSAPNINSKNAKISSNLDNNPVSQTALSDFLKAKTSATSGTALDFHVGGTEAIIAAYYVPILEEAELNHWR